MTPPPNPHFARVGSWEEAASMLTFEPRRPGETFGRALESLSIFVRDHRHRDLRVEDRTLEAHYGSFSVSQSRKGTAEARHWVVDVRYGPAPLEAVVAGHEARVYELGPEPPPGDIDGRVPSVVVWHDGEMHYLVASDQLALESLLDIAQSMYLSRIGEADDAS